MGFGLLGVQAREMVEEWGVLLRESVQIPGFSGGDEGVFGQRNGAVGAEECGGFIASEVPHRTGGTTSLHPSILTWSHCHFKLRPSRKGSWSRYPITTTTPSWTIDQI